MCKTIKVWRIEDHVQEQFGDLKETVIEEIKGMVITQVITAGVKWIIGLLNPASAFVKAAMAIYDIIMFFINRGSQVMELVNSVIKAVSAIANGAVGGAAKLVENALARALPVVIGFLASLLGVGGLAKKVERIITRIRARIDKAVDSLLMKIRRLFRGKRGKANKDKEGDKITSADQKKHEKIAVAIEKDLTKKPKKSQKSFEEFYKSKTQQAKKLEKKYQRQLKKGIKLDIKFKPIAQDNKDGDIDVAIKIAPNDLYTTFELAADEDEAKFSKLLYEALKQLGEEHHISGHKSEFAKDTDIKKGDFSENAQEQEQTALDKKKAEKEKEIKEKSQGIHQEILKAQNSYAIACQATIVPNNIFTVGSGDFFVETHDNYYIIPKEEAIDKFEYKILGKRKLLKNVLKEEAIDRSSQALEKELNKAISNLEQKEKIKQILIEKNKDFSKVENQITSTKDKIKKLTAQLENHDNSELENLASATTTEDKRKQVEFVQEKLNDKNYKHIKNIKGGQVKIYLTNTIVKDYDYHGNPIEIEEAKELYKGFPKTIKPNDQKHTVFLASLLAEPSRSSVAHITNMLLLNEESELSKDSEPPKQVTASKKDGRPIDGGGQLRTEREKDKLYEHTSMTQPGSDPSGSRTKDYLYDPRLQQGENDKATNINVSNRDLAAIKHNKEVKDKLLKYFNERKNAEDSQLVNYFKQEIKEYLNV